MPHLPRVLLPATVLAAVAAAALTAAPPAVAGVTGTTSSGEVVLYQQCQQHPIDYQLTETGLPVGWRLEIQVFDPQGRTSEGAVLNSATNPPLSGTVYKTFCGSEPAGTWTVKGTVRSALGDASIPDLPVSTFTVRAAQTTTGLTKKHLGPRKNRLNAKVREEVPGGWARAEGVVLRLERRVGADWQPVRRTTLTVNRGRASTVVTGRGTYRVVVPAGDNLGGSESRAVSVR